MKYRACLNIRLMVALLLLSIDNLSPRLPTMGHDINAPPDTKRVPIIAGATNIVALALLNIFSRAIIILSNIRYLSIKWARIVIKAIIEAKDKVVDSKRVPRKILVNFTRSLPFNIASKKEPTNNE